MSWSCPHPILIVSLSCLIHDPVLSPFCPGCVPVLSPSYSSKVSVLSQLCLHIVSVLSWLCPHSILVISPCCPYPVTILSLSCPCPVPIMLLCPHSVSFVSYRRHLTPLCSWQAHQPHCGERADPPVPKSHPGGERGLGPGSTPCGDVGCWGSPGLSAPRSGPCCLRP